MRATRRLDQLRQAQKETVGLNRGAAVSTRVDEKPTLASQGIEEPRSSGDQQKARPLSRAVWRSG
jgi:hypothetical protein